MARNALTFSIKDLIEIAAQNPSHAGIIIHTHAFGYHGRSRVKIDQLRKDTGWGLSRFKPSPSVYELKEVGRREPDFMVHNYAIGTSIMHYTFISGEFAVIHSPRLFLMSSMPTSGIWMPVGVTAEKSIFA